MKSTIVANVRMVQKYDSDTTKGINVFCEEENEGLNENLLGPVQLVIGGPLEMFPTFQAFYRDNLLPGQIEMTVDIGRGSGGKAKLTLISVKDPALQSHLKQGKPTSNETAKAGS